MKYEIKVPAMGESISEATVSAILKQAGSQVQMDDELLELATDKVNQVLYAPNAGIFTPTVKEDDVVIIGQVIGVIDAEGKAAAEESKAPSHEESPKSPKPAKEAEKPTQEIAKSTKESVKSAPETGKPIAEGTAKAENNVEKFDVQAKGEQKKARVSTDEFIDSLKKPPEKTVTTASRAAGTPPTATPSPISSSKPKVERETRRKMSKIRKIIATRLVEVQQNTAMLTTFNEVDLTQIMALREKYKDSFAKEHGVRLGFMSFFVRAAVSALKDFPNINSYIDGDDIVHREYYDIGIAVGTEKGLVVPIVRNCDQLSFAQVEGAIADFAAKVKSGKLSADDLQGGGFTITNGGVYGSLLSTPILNPNQCAILGMHKIMKRPVVVDDQIVIRQMMYLALSYDHRIVDGKEAVSFLVHIKNWLEDPARMLLDV